MSKIDARSGRSSLAGGEPKSSRPYMPGYGIKPADEGEGLLPWSWAAERLAASHGYWVSTVKPDGAPHCMPVWGVWINGKFLFSSGAQSRKARNLRASSKCVICTDRPDQAVVVEGAAQQTTDAELMREFCRAYQEKYKWDMTDFSEPIFVVEPTVAFAVTESKDGYTFTGSATRWTFDD